MLGPIPDSFVRSSPLPVAFLGVVFAFVLVACVEVVDLPVLFVAAFLAVLAGFFDAATFLAVLAGFFDAATFLAVLAGFFDAATF